MAFVGGSHSWRKHDHLVGHRKGVGEILVAPLMQARGECRLHLTQLRVKLSNMRIADEWILWVNSRIGATCFWMRRPVKTYDLVIHRLRHWRAGGKLANACGRVVRSIGRSPSLWRDLRAARLRSEESADERCGGDRRGDAYARAWRHRRGPESIGTS